VELTRSGLLATLVVFLVAAACIRLGFWQLDRRDQRMGRNAAVAERLATEPIVLNAPPADTVGLANRRARLAGWYDHDRTFALIGRSHMGTPGVHIFTPFRMGEGAVLVNRGWVPAPDAATVDLGALHRPADAEVTGVLLPFPDIRTHAADEGFRARWFRLDRDAIGAGYPYAIAPIYVQVTDHAARTGSGIQPLALPPPELGAGPHLSYAIQWFSFAAIFLIGWAVLVVRRTSPGTPPRD
jgi:surfeit locus 1 family protein